MSQDKRKPYCKKYKTSNTRKENFQMEETRPKCGRLMEIIENFSCCPAPTAGPKSTIDVCDKTVFNNTDFFTRPNDQCANPTLTQYGKEFVAGTGKTVSSYRFYNNFNICLCREIHFSTFLITIYCCYII